VFIEPLRSGRRKGNSLKLIQAVFFEEVETNCRDNGGSFNGSAYQVALDLDGCKLGTCKMSIIMIGPGPRGNSRLGIISCDFESSAPSLS
jgi:hypothetical protein